MSPIMLSAACHDQQRAAGQFELDFLVGNEVLQNEATAFSQIDGGDDRIAAQLWFIVLMPAH